MEIIFLIILVLVILIIFLYNSLVRLKTNRENAFADIDVQLKQRYDLIPQLIETVKWAKNFEKEVLTQIVEARTKAITAKSVDEKINAENKFMWALSWFFAVSESYPEIKSNQNFLQLQNEISDIENKLSATRRFFNSATKELNVAVKTFPSNIIAWIFGFKEEIFFEIQNKEELEKAPEIKF